MTTANELSRLANDILKDGFADINEEVITKVAQATALFNKSTEIAEGIPMKKNRLEKIASNNSNNSSTYGDKFVSGLGRAAAVGLGLAITGRALDKAEELYDEIKYEKKKNKIINFAKEENPDLQEVSDKRMSQWLDSAYVVSPNVAKDPMLATTYLNTAHAVGGADLNTAKTIAEIQQRGGKSYDKNLDAIRSQANLMTEAISL